MAKKKNPKSQPNIELALEVSDVADLCDIRLIEAKSKLIDDPSKENKYDITVSSDYKIGEDKKGLLVVLRLKLEAKTASGEDIARIEATYLVVYTLKKEKEFSDKHYNQFADFCSVFHIWPYWREHVQNSMATFRLPPLTLPAHKFGALLPKEKSIINQEK